MRSPIRNMEAAAVTNGGLRNDVLGKFLRQFCRRHFAGIFYVDTVPPRLLNIPRRRGKCFIINLSLSHWSDGHFVAIYIRKRNLWYFDSYALPPPAHLVNLLRRWKKNGKGAGIKCVLTYPVQSFNSLFCGWYAAAFCMMVALYSGCDPCHISNFFSRQNLSQNETIVQYLIQLLCYKLTRCPK